MLGTSPKMGGKKLLQAHSKNSIANCSLLIANCHSPYCTGKRAYEYTKSNQGGSQMKKFLSILLTLCLLLGMTSLVASAATETEVDSNTVFLALHSDEYLSIYSYGYQIGNNDAVPFTGNYILTGKAWYVYVSASCDITFLDMNIIGTGSVFYGFNNDTVNLTAIGENTIATSNYYSLYGNLSINLTVADNSSLTLKCGSNYGVMGEEVTLTMADGSPLPALSDDGSLTVSKGTPADHFTYTKSSDGKSHTVFCADHDIEFTESCYAAKGEYVDADTCKTSCICGRALSTEGHAFSRYTNDYDENGHTFTCSSCGYSYTQPHTYEKEYYDYVDENTCAPECDSCYYTKAPVKHSYTEYSCYDDENCILSCEHCGNYLDGYTKLHNFDDGTALAATNERGSSTMYTCADCEYERITPDYDKAIVVKVVAPYSWYGNAIAVYVNGVPTRVITNHGYCMKEAYDEVYVEEYSIEYDPTASYSFKWIADSYNSEYSQYYGVQIHVPGKDYAACSYAVGEMTDISSFTTLLSINEADYSKVDAAIAKIPAFLEDYSAASVNKLVTALKGVKRMLPASKQNDVDKMAAAVETAVSELVAIENSVPNGVINLNSGYGICIDSDTYYYANDNTRSPYFEYDGKYVLIGSYTEMSDQGAWIYDDGDYEIDMINTVICSKYSSVGCYDDSNLTLNLYGANLFDSYDSSAGIDVVGDSKLTINDTDGSLLSVGSWGSSGIGGYVTHGHRDCGEINIKGSTVFALSRGYGAGIGGGVYGSAGKITIDGGVVYAESLYGDAAGIGCGDDGEGGDITINDGDVTALTLSNDADGAGIGSSRYGSIDTITINGGNIVAGSIWGAAVGGGYSTTYCGQIAVNGGTVSTSIFHSDYHCIIGHTYNYENYIISPKSSVKLTGGTIINNMGVGINPAPTDANGKVLNVINVKLNEKFVGENIILTLSDGTKVETNSASESFSIYAPEGTKISTVSYSDGSGLEDYDDGDDDDDMFWLWKFFLSIFEWFGSVFQKIGSFFSGLFA